MTGISAEPVTAKAVIAEAVTALAIGVRDALAAYSPVSLFGNGEIGTVPRLSDFATLRQNSDGTGIVSDWGDPVGFALDPSKGTRSFDDLGPELWDNGSTNIANGAVDLGGGVYQIDNTVTGGNAQVNMVNTAVIGEWYQAQFTVDAVDAREELATLNGEVEFAGLVEGQTYTKIYQATTTSFGIKRVFSNTDITISNLSFRALSGNHFIQPTSTARVRVARRPMTGRRNLLPSTESFSDYFIGSGTDSGKEITFNGTENNDFFASGLGADTQGVECAFRIVVEGVSGDAGYRAYIREYNGSSFLAQTLSAEQKLSGDTVFTVSRTGDQATGDNWFVGLQRRTTDAADGDTIRIKEIQFETGTLTPTAYQRVASKYDITEAGVADKIGVISDGTDDSLYTSAFDLDSEEATLFMAFENLRPQGTTQCIAGHGDAFGSDSTLTVFSPSNTNDQNMNIQFAGSSIENNGQGVAPIVQALAIRADFVSATLKCEGTAIVNKTGANSGTGPFKEEVFAIGKRGSADNGYAEAFYTEAGIINRFATDDETETLADHLKTTQGIAA
jgi:hypothetical protein